MIKGTETVSNGSTAAGYGQLKQQEHRYFKRKLAEIILCSIFSLLVLVVFVYRLDVFIFTIIGILQLFFWGFSFFGLYQRKALMDQQRLFVRKGICTAKEREKCFYSVCYILFESEEGGKEKLRVPPYMYRNISWGQPIVYAAVDKFFRELYGVYGLKAEAENVEASGEPLWQTADPDLAEMIQKSESRRFFYRTSRFVFASVMLCLCVWGLFLFGFFSRIKEAGFALLFAAVLYFLFCFYRKVYFERRMLYLRYGVCREKKTIGMVRPDYFLTAEMEDTRHAEGLFINTTAYQEIKPGDRVVFAVTDPAAARVKGVYGIR